jgi:hypothetical protein
MGSGISPVEREPGSGRVHHQSPVDDSLVDLEVSWLYITQYVPGTWYLQLLADVVDG